MPLRLFTLLVLALTPLAPVAVALAQDTQPGCSGSFFNPDRSGHGFVFEDLRSGDLLISEAAAILLPSHQVDLVPE